MGSTPPLMRDHALEARPVAARILTRHSLGNGAERVTIGIRTQGMRRWLLRRPEIIERQFELDAFGIHLVHCCDGHHSVQSIIERFATKYRLDPAEAEKAVTAFLQILIRKGILTMIIDEGRESIAETRREHK